MSNHLNSDQQLDQAVKDALESYEAPFDPSAWADMEKQLAAQPKPFNPFKKFSFSLNTIIAVGVVGGGLLIYKLSASNDNTPPVKETVTAIEMPKQQPPKTEPAPVITQTPVMPSDSVSSEAEPQAEVAENPPPSSNLYAGDNSSDAIQPKKKDKKKSDTSKTVSSSKDEEVFDFMKVADRATKSAPAFGDQIDPVKGFINPSSESDNVKREAFNKTSGWGDQVLKTMKSDSATRSKIAPPKAVDPADTEDDSPSGNKSDKKQKPKKSSSSDKEASEKQNDEEVSSNAGSDSGEQNDTTEKSKVKGKNTPRYKTDKTVIDP